MCTKGAYEADREEVAVDAAGKSKGTCSGAGSRFGLNVNPPGNRWRRRSRCVDSRAAGGGGATAATSCPGDASLQLCQPPAR
jgi:hypothetical protein